MACNCAVSFREGNNIYGVYACDTGRRPLAIRYLVDPVSPADMTISPTGDKYTVRSLSMKLFAEIGGATLEGVGNHVLRGSVSTVLTATG